MNWLTIAVILFIVLMLAWGAFRGLIKMVISVTSLVLSFVLVIALHDPVENLVKNNTSLEAAIEKTVRTYITDHVDAAAAKTSLSAKENIETQIEKLNLPAPIKDALKKGLNEDNGVYQAISQKAATLSDYLTLRLTAMAFSALIYLFLFIAVRIIILIITLVLKSLSKLPVLRQVNSLAGAFAGLILALFFLWIGGLVITAAAGTSWGQEALRLISESRFLTFIYRSNIFVKMSVS